MFDTHYKSIKTLPYNRWIDCHDGNLKALRKRKFGTDTLDAKAWEFVLNSYLTEFGFSEVFKELMELKRRRAELEHEMLTAMLEQKKLMVKERKNLNEINELTAKIDKIEENKGEEVKPIDTLSELRIAGMAVDGDKMTVYEVEKLARKWQSK